MKQRYEKGERFTMTEAALENYGEDHRGKVYAVDARYTDDHQGFDSNGGPYIYDIKGLNFSLYPYEMRAV